MYKLEHRLHGIETLLSIATAIPIVGTVVGGPAKAVLGLVQTISAIAITIITGVGALFHAKGAKECCIRASKHIVHGIGNILGGIIEAIPIVGSVSGYIRYLSWNSAHPKGPGAGNYLAYGDLYKPEANHLQGLEWFHTKPLPVFVV